CRPLDLADARGRRNDGLHVVGDAGQRVRVRIRDVGGAVGRIGAGGAADLDVVDPLGAARRIRGGVDRVVQGLVVVLLHPEAGARPDLARVGRLHDVVVEKVADGAPVHRDAQQHVVVVVVVVGDLAVGV